jgi:hypothetical protein
MSAYEMLSAAISAAGLLAVALSLVRLREQLQLATNQTASLQRALEVSAESAIDDLFAVATNAFIQWPELRAVFNPDECPPRRLTRETTLRASAIAEILCDAMERSLTVRDVGLSPVSKRLEPWINDSLEKSAFLRTWLLDHRDWYPDELVELAEAAEKSAAVSARSRT